MMHLRAPSLPRYTTVRSLLPSTKTYRYRTVCHRILRRAIFQMIQYNSNELLRSYLQSERSVVLFAVSLLLLLPAPKYSVLGTHILFFSFSSPSQALVIFSRPSQATGTIPTSPKSPPARRRNGTAAPSRATSPKSLLLDLKL
jgi:hypothetical protein